MRELNNVKDYRREALALVNQGISLTECDEYSYAKYFLNRDVKKFRENLSKLRNEVEDIDDDDDFIDFMDEFIVSIQKLVNYSKASREEAKEYTNFLMEFEFRKVKVSVGDDARQYAKYFSNCFRSSKAAGYEITEVYVQPRVLKYPGIDKEFIFKGQCGIE